MRVCVGGTRVGVDVGGTRVGVGGTDVGDSGTTRVASVAGVGARSAVDGAAARSQPAAITARVATIASARHNPMDRLHQPHGLIAVSNRTRHL